MKRLRHLLAASALTLVAIANSNAVADDSYLLRTQWYQDGPFAQFTPNRVRVGCWSTAYAQILYYHRLKPTGRVTYECSSGHKIDVNLDQYRFDWNKFAGSVTAATPQETVEQLAQYSFATAAVVRKDFGTGSYRRVLSSVADLEAHFPVDAEIYVYVIENPPIPLDVLKARVSSENISNAVDKAQIVALLTTELGAGRPVYFHFANLKEFGHSTVIDGIRKEGDRYMVHINFGDVVTARNRWYDLFAPIEVKDDDILRAFVTIKPLAAASLPKRSPRLLRQS
jgi:hypothetical protein